MTWSTLQGGGVLVLLLLLWSLWAVTIRPVRVTVDGITEEVWTHRHTVGALLLDLGVTVDAHDQVTPPPATSIRRNLHLTVARARPFRIWADGRERVITSWGATPQAVLADAGIFIDRYDRVLLNSQPVDSTAPLPPPVTMIAAPTYDRGYGWQAIAHEPAPLVVQRAVPLTVDEGDLPYTIRTTAQTVGQALRQAEITLYLGDHVQPSLGSQVTAGLRVMIQRSIPIALQVDGRLVKTRTRAKTVGGALTELQIGVMGGDQVQPGPETALTDNLSIAITRVHEEVAIKEEIIPIETVFEPDPNLAIDTQQVVNQGAPGINRQRFRVRYEDGEEVARTLEDSWVAQEPTQRVIAYGQRVEPQTFTTADGTQITYWRKIRAYASSYSASTAGVSPDKSYYGRTFTGDIMRSGIIAVDPRVIPLRTKLYVPGYGAGDALDTGSAILGRRVDLGYDDDKLVLWTRWVDVYLLWPPPPSYQITWVLPNYPRE